MNYIFIIAPTQFKTLVGGYSWPRVVGLSNNPNVYAVIVSIGLLIGFSLYLYEKKKHNLFFLAINFIVLMMTLSRAGLTFCYIYKCIFALIYQ